MAGFVSLVTPSQVGRLFCVRSYKQQPLSIRRERGLSTADAITLADIYRRGIGHLEEDVAPLHGTSECLFRLPLHINMTVAISPGPSLQIFHHLQILARSRVVR